MKYNSASACAGVLRASECWYCPPLVCCRENPCPTANTVNTAIRTAASNATSRRLENSRARTHLARGPSTCLELTKSRAAHSAGRCWLCSLSPSHNVPNAVSSCTPASNAPISTPPVALNVCNRSRSALRRRMPETNAPFTRSAFALKSRLRPERPPLPTPRAKPSIVSSRIKPIHFWLAFAPIAIWVAAGEKFNRRS